MTLIRFVVIGLALVGVASVATAQRGNRSPTSLAPSPSCALHVSQTSTPLTDSSGSLNFLDQPVVASVNGGQLWFGPQVIPWPPVQSASEFSGLVKKADGTTTLIARPPSTQEIQMPILINAAGNVAHLVWSEREDTSKTARSNGDAQVTKYSAFNGSKWTKPEIVLHARDLAWTPSIPATLSLGVHKFVATLNMHNVTDSNLIQLLVSRREGKQWRQAIVAESRVIWGIQSVRMQSVADTIVLTYGGRVKNSDSVTTRSAMFVVRSRNAGSTWDAPKLVWYFPPGTVPQLGGLHRQADGSLHLFWAARVDGTPLAPAVMHQVSRDGGLTWRMADSLAVPKKIDYLLSAEVGSHFIVTVRQSNGILGQFVAGTDAALQEVSDIPSPLLPVNFLRSSEELETVWGRYQKVTTRDKQTYGLAAVTYSARSKVDCIGK